MPIPRYSDGEALRRAQEIYERDIRHQVEPNNRGRYLMLDFETGEYEIGEDCLELSQRILARKPEAQLFAFRIGYATTGRIGARSEPAAT